MIMNFLAPSIIGKIGKRVYKINVDFSKKRGTDSMYFILKASADGGNSDTLSIEGDEHKLATLISVNGDHFAGHDRQHSISTIEDLVDYGINIIENEIENS